jgi:hypothetical protein
MAVAWSEHESFYHTIVETTRALEVGGGVARSVLPAERVDFLDRRAEFALSLESQLPDPAKQTKWDAIFREALIHIKTEYRNSDLKIVEGSVGCLQDHYLYEDEVVQGKRGNSTVNPHMHHMVTFERPRSNGTTRHIRVSPLDAPGDRRSGPNVTRLQQVVRTAKGKLVDRITGLEISPTDVRDITEQLPLSFFERNQERVDEGSFMTQFGRFVLNNIRFFGYINGSQAEHYQKGYSGWIAPNEFYVGGDSGKYITRDIRVLVEGSLNSVGFVKEIDATMSEFRSRMIASFLISPRLFMDISRAYRCHVVFPNLATLRSTSFYKDPQYFKFVDVVELETVVKDEVLGKYYDSEAGLLSNIGRMFAFFPIEGDGCIGYNN